MKTKEQEMNLLGLQEINDSEKDEISGGRLYPWELNPGPDWCVPQDLFKE